MALLLLITIWFVQPANAVGPAVTDASLDRHSMMRAASTAESPSSPRQRTKQVIEIEVDSSGQSHHPAERFVEEFSFQHPVGPNDLHHQAGRSSDRHATSSAHTESAHRVNSSAADAPQGDVHGRAENFVSKESLQTYIHALLIVISLQVVAVVLFEVFHKQWSETSLDRQLPPIAEQPHSQMTSLFAGLGTLCGPYFATEAGTKGRLYLCAVAILSAAGLFVAFVHNMWQKEWWDVFQHRQAERFTPLIGQLVAIIIAAMLAGVYQDYIKQMLVIHWRSFMTRRLYSLWLHEHTHFFMQISGSKAGTENPDQRIQEDVRMFAESTLNLAFGCFESMGNLVVFGPVILFLEPSGPWGLRLPGWLLQFALLWSVTGSIMTHAVGRNLIRVSFAQQRYEADFRRQAVHIQSNAESIVLYNAENTEAQQLQEHFENIKVIFWQHMIYNKRLTFYTVAYGYLSFIIPFMVLAPAFFRKEISLGDLFQLTGALGQVRGSLDWFINSYGLLTQWRATADRLLSFEDAVSATAAMKPSQQLLCNTVSPKVEDAADDSEDPPWLRLRVAEVRLPAGAVLWRNVSLEVQRGQKVLISGGEGIGKSVLFKAWAGVWPWVVDSEVQWAGGERQEVLFVPQRPALPKACTLRRCISYPELEVAYPDADIEEALQAVGLDGLLHLEPNVGGDEVGDSQVDDSPATSPGEEQPESEVNGLDRVADWSMLLSPGMQQRLAIGHALLQQPRLLLLDEATSNVSREAAVELYTLLFSRLPGDAVVISISHDVETVRPFHDIHYQIEGVGEEKILVTPGVAGTGEK